MAKPETKKYRHIYEIPRSDKRDRCSRCFRVLKPFSHKRKDPELAGQPARFGSMCVKCYLHSYPQKEGA